MKRNTVVACCFVWMLAVASLFAVVSPEALRCEYLVDPQGVEETAPRLSWEPASRERGQKQTAWRVLVAASKAQLEANKGDLWDSGKVTDHRNSGIVYKGQPLKSRQTCFWKVQLWDKDGKVSAWSPAARWSMGLLEAGDWVGQWISYRDTSPLHTNRGALYLPPAHHYRKEFQVGKKVARATVYASALGLYELHLNGERVSDALFTPGWSDYIRRAYYNTYDVTSLVRSGNNALGTIVTDGWYAGYVGYGLLVGYGPYKVGRYFYGKTPSFMAQLEIEYSDGSKEVVATDNTWLVTDKGPIREADFIMGETCDARMELPGWDKAGFKAEGWQQAISAEQNGSTKATFYDNRGARPMELGFQKPSRMQAYSAPPIKMTEELKAVRITEPAKGTYLFDLGQNFAGVIRLKVKGTAGSKIRIRYGEMLHQDGRLMTENLRKARATDYYILRGDARGEVWTPRFTYHGFQYVELTGLDYKPELDAVTGLVLHNDNPSTSKFACSDEIMNRFYKNTLWTQRANFIEVPTDCPQRDERLGWMGDAQVYVRTASYNADVSAFFTKWLDDLEEAQLPSGAYPDYCPYPMGHGGAGKNFGTAWTDAGIICPWTIWLVYGDTRVIDRHWASMQRFMDWRKASTTPEGLGVSIGNDWGDWLNVNENTPIEYIDTCYHALTCKMMAEMAEATGRTKEGEIYRQRFETVRQAFNKAYVNENGTIRFGPKSTNDTQTAYVLALWIGLMPQEKVAAAGARLVERIAKNDYRMATGFLGTKPLLLALTSSGHHDLAVRLFQSKRFPSWGYEVVNGATSVWERWDSYTKEDGFGRHNAAMNSYSHYSFGGVMEWAFRDLAGIDTDGAGFQRLIIRPGPPAMNSNPENKPIDWVNADYRSINGLISSHWKQANGRFELNLVIPVNTTATVYLPASGVAEITENGRKLTSVKGVKFVKMDGRHAVLTVESGSYKFSSRTQ